MEKKKIYKLIKIIIIFLIAIILIFKSYNEMKIAETGKIVELTDTMITNNLVAIHRNNLILSIIAVICSICMLIGSVYVIVVAKKKDKKAFFIISSILIIGTLVFGMLSVSLYKKDVEAPKIKNEKDWKISVGTVIEKYSKQHYKSGTSYYIRVNDSNKEVSVTENEYFYIEKNDEVYVIYDKDNEIVKVYPSQKYNYIGKKLKTNKTQTVTANNNDAERYYSWKFWGYTIGLVSFILGVIINEVINKKIIDEEQRFQHSELLLSERRRKRKACRTNISYRN